jgi:parallel beta-helix repeat protein
VPNVYYAVCPGTGGTSDKKTGSPTITIASGVATLSVAQTGNIGQGFRITYDTSKVCFISKVNSSTSFDVVTATGGTPSNEASAVTVNSIAADYASLSAAEAGASDSSHLNTSDLATAKTILNLVCYAGASADTASVTISGYTVGVDYYVSIYTPTGGTQSISTNRHQGIPSGGTAYILKPPISGICTNNYYTRVDGIEITDWGYTGGGRFAIGDNGSTCDYKTISNCLMHTPRNAGATTLYGIQTTNGSDGCNIFNNIVCNFNFSGVTCKGIQCARTNNVYNNTVYNVGTGIWTADSGTPLLKNNAVFNTDTADYSGTFSTSGSNNASEDGTAPGTDIDLSGYTAAQIWTDAANGDFSLVSGSPLYDAGADLSAYFTTDIAGTTRSTWDIGAFEYVAATGFIPIIMNHLQKMRAN